MRSVLLLACILPFSGVSAYATPITVDFVKAEVPPDSTHVALPFLMNGANDVLFLKFRIPDISLVESIDSFDINVTLYDDDDKGGETGRILFALPGPNLPLIEFGPNLNGFTAGSPLTLTMTLCPCDIAEVFPSILDGNFRIRLVRESGDFVVAGGSVSIDATLIPEPASVSLVAGGLLGLAGLLHRRLRSRTQQ